jgi:hypothetical protein
MREPRDLVASCELEQCSAIAPAECLHDTESSKRRSARIVQSRLLVLLWDGAMQCYRTSGELALHGTLQARMRTQLATTATRPYFCNVNGEYQMRDASCYEAVYGFEEEVCDLLL